MPARWFSIPSLPWLRATAATLIVLTGGALPAAAQHKLLTIDDLYDPVKRVSFGAPPAAGAVTWLGDAVYLVAREIPGERGRFAHVRVEAVTGKETPLFEPMSLQSAIGQVPGVTADEAARLSRLRSYTMNPAHTGLLVTVGDDLYFWLFGAGAVQPITASPGEEQEAAFSPDGKLVAFVRDSNLHVTDLAGRERALTTDGHAQLLNGKLDWVYQEEIYGRGTFRAFWWSPDSKHIAYLQLDESPVHEFTVVDHIPVRQEVERTDYPKPGDPNPLVRLGVVGAAGGPTRWIATDKYAGEILIVDVSWAPAGQIVFQVQNREQTWLDLNVAEAVSGAARTVVRETTKAWVSVLGSPHYLKDGSFLWFSERTGWQHLYHYKADGTLVRPVTDGQWDISALHGVDEASGWIYFSATERSYTGRDVYRARLDGTGRARLSNPPGTHLASFNPALTLYVGRWSDIGTPPQVRVHRADGSEVRVADRNAVPALSEYRLSKPEFLQVPTRDGFLMEALLIRPPDFDPTKKYPVLQSTYAGPNAPQVRNAWGGTTHLFYQLLAQRGVVIWVMDNRSASGKGAQSAWAAYKRLGESELRDIEDGVAWLKQQPWVDASRIGITGWSYGGFMTSYALTHSTSFAMGIAGGSVTDWRAYDSIYTERYMLMPQNNPDGYAQTAPRAAAKQLHGRLLLLHGTLDDNVHVQNTIQFAYELQKAGKSFELMLYPKSRHGVVDPLLNKHMRQTMLDFVLRTLQPVAPGASQTARVQ